MNPRRPRAEEVEFWMCLKVQTARLCTGWKWCVLGVDGEEFEIVPRFMA